MHTMMQESMYGKKVCDDVLKEQIQSTYKTDDMVAWELNRLLNSPHPQFTKLREDKQYLEMLNKWAR